MTIFQPHAAATPPGVNRLDGRVVGRRVMGPLVTIRIDCGFPLNAYLLVPQARAIDLADGSPVAVGIAADAIHIMTE